MQVDHAPSRIDLFPAIDSYPSRQHRKHCGLSICLLRSHEADDLLQNETAQQHSQCCVNCQSPNSIEFHLSDFGFVWCVNQTHARSRHFHIIQRQYYLCYLQKPKTNERCGVQKISISKCVVLFD